MGQVNLPTNILDTIRQMQRDIAAVRKRVGLGNATVSAGDFTIQEGGTFRLLHPNGNVIAQIGNLGVIGGESVWGIQAKRPDGTEALFVYGTESGASTFFGMRDKAGNIIISDDSVSGQGLATPHIPLTPPQPSGSSAGIAMSWPRTTSATFVTVMDCYNPALQPRLRIFAAASCDSGGTTGEMRALINGDQIGPTVTIPSGSSDNLDGTYPVPNWATGLGYGAEIHFELQIRRTGGANNVYAMAFGLYGQQS